MSQPLMLDNLWAWSLQAAAIIAAAGLLAWVFRLQGPRARLGLWRIVLLAVVAAFFQPRQRPEAAAGAVSFTTGPMQTAAAPAARAIDPRVMIPSLLVLGILMRCAWIGLGLLQLRRYRRRSKPLALPYEIEDLRLWLAPECEVRSSGDITCPVTFGWLRPVVLLPEACERMPLPARRAMLCHEFVHVRRRDWLHTLVESLADAALWFHPAVWWLLSRIHISREQAVDQETVRRTEARQEYLEALLAIASAQLKPAWASAPLFLKKRHLAERVAALLKETPMSKTRLVASFSMILSLLAVAARVAVLQFPMRAPAQEIRQGGDRLLHRSAIQYPREAMEKKIEGTVVLEATIDEKGVVTDARVLSGPQELRKAALTSVLSWHYSKEVRGPATIPIAIDFKAPPLMTAPPPPPPPPPPPGATLGRINFFGISEEMKREITSRLPVREGAPITNDDLNSVRAFLKDIDEHLNANLLVKTGPAGNEGQLIIGLHAESAGVRVATAPPPPPPDDGTMRIRVGGNVQQARLTYQPPPVYPALARQARIQGTVQFNATIDTDGTIKSLELVSGHPLLVQSAHDAVKQWTYAPTHLNGQPAVVITSINVNYTLTE
ncbi:MAG: TonB family protein [Bryobacteraceae bacterium]